VIQTAFESDFLDCMPHSIVVNAFSSIDSFGQVTHSTDSTTYAGLFQQDQKLIRDLDGQEKVSNASAIISSSGATISPDDLITLPDGTVRKIIAIATLYDEEGQHHTEIMFG